MPSFDVHYPKIGGKIGLPDFDIQGPKNGVPSLEINRPEIDIRIFVASKVEKSLVLYKGFYFISYIFFKICIF